MDPSKPNKRHRPPIAKGEPQKATKKQKLNAFGGVKVSSLPSKAALLQNRATGTPTPPWKSSSPAQPRGRGRPTGKAPSKPKKKASKKRASKVPDSGGSPKKRAPKKKRKTSTAKKKSPAKPRAKKKKPARGNPPDSVAFPLGKQPDFGAGGTPKNLKRPSSPSPNSVPDVPFLSRNAFGHALEVNDPFDNSRLSVPVHMNLEEDDPHTIEPKPEPQSSPPLGPGTAHLGQAHHFNHHNGSHPHHPAYGGPARPRAPTPAPGPLPGQWGHPPQPGDDFLGDAPGAPPFTPKTDTVGTLPIHAETANMTPERGEALEAIRNYKYHLRFQISRIRNFLFDNHEKQRIMKVMMAANKGPKKRERRTGSSKKGSKGVDKSKRNKLMSDALFADAKGCLPLPNGDAMITRKRADAPNNFHSEERPSHPERKLIVAAAETVAIKLGLWRLLEDCKKTGYKFDNKDIKKHLKEIRQFKISGVARDEEYVKAIDGKDHPYKLSLKHCWEEVSWDAFKAQQKKTGKHRLSEPALGKNGEQLRVPPIRFPSRTPDQCRVIVNEARLYEKTSKFLTTQQKKKNDKNAKKEVLPPGKKITCPNKGAQNKLTSATMLPGVWREEDDKLLEEKVKEYGDCGHWEEVASFFKDGRHPICALARRQRKANKATKHVWSKQEDLWLSGLVPVLGENDWGGIARYFDEITANQCHLRWRNTLRPNIRHAQHWTKLEDVKVNLCVQVFGKAWVQVSKFIDGRTDLSCRERFVNFLDPSINSAAHFSDKEIKDLERLVKKHGQGKWSKIARELGTGRTDWFVSRMWHDIQKNGVEMMKIKRKNQQLQNEQRDAQRRFMAKPDTPARGPLRNQSYYHNNKVWIHSMPSAPALSPAKPQLHAPPPLPNPKLPAVPVAGKPPPALADVLPSLPPLPEGYVYKPTFKLNADGSKIPGYVPVKSNKAGPGEQPPPPLPPPGTTKLHLTPSTKPVVGRLPMNGHHPLNHHSNHQMAPSRGQLHANAMAPHPYSSASAAAADALQVHGWNGHSAVRGGHPQMSPPPPAPADHFRPSPSPSPGIVPVSDHLRLHSPPLGSGPNGMIVGSMRHHQANLSQLHPSTSPPRHQHHLRLASHYGQGSVSSGYDSRTLLPTNGYSNHHPYHHPPPAQQAFSPHSALGPAMPNANSNNMGGSSPTSNSLYPFASSSAMALQPFLARSPSPSKDDSKASELLPGPPLPDAMLTEEPDHPGALAMPPGRPPPGSPRDPSNLRQQPPKAGVPSVATDTLRRSPVSVKSEHPPVDHHVLNHHPYSNLSSPKPELSTSPRRHLNSNNHVVHHDVNNHHLGLSRPPSTASRRDDGTKTDSTGARGPGALAVGPPPLPPSPGRDPQGVPHGPSGLPDHRTLADHPATGPRPSGLEREPPPPRTKPPLLVDPSQKRGGGAFLHYGGGGLVLPSVKLSSEGQSNWEFPPPRELPLNGGHQRLNTPGPLNGGHQQLNTNGYHPMPNGLQHLPLNGLEAMNDLQYRDRSGLIQRLQRRKEKYT